MNDLQFKKVKCYVESKGLRIGHMSSDKWNHTVMVLYWGLLEGTPQAFENFYSDKQELKVAFDCGHLRYFTSADLMCVFVVYNLIIEVIICNDPEDYRAYLEYLTTPEFF